MKKKPRSTEELAVLYKEGRLPLDAALEKHFRNHGLWPISDDDFLTVQLVIGFGNLGVTDKIVSLSGDRKLTIAQVIEAYNLRPFLEAVTILNTLPSDVQIGEGNITISGHSHGTNKEEGMDREPHGQANQGLCVGMAVSGLFDAAGPVLRSPAAEGPP